MCRVRTPRRENCRFFDTRAQVPDDAPGPLAATLRAGSIDLSRVGDRFAALDTPIYSCGPEGLRATFTLAGLLPHSFGPENLLD